MSKIVATANTTLACFGDVPIAFELRHVRGNIYRVADSLCLGNMVICDAADGILVADAKIADCYPALGDMIKSYFNKPVRFLVNTHCHPDHVAGNAAWCAEKPLIIAHANTHKYLSGHQVLPVINEEMPALPPACRPNCLVNEELTLLMDNETLTLKNMNGHTDGDLVMFCQEANVVHAADLCSFGSLPYIGINVGGSIDMMLKSLRRLADMVDDETIIIPGHGDPRDKRGFLEYMDLLQEARDNVAERVREKATMAETVSCQPASSLFNTCAPGVGPLTQPMFEELIFQDIART